MHRGVVQRQNRWATKQRQQRFDALDHKLCRHLLLCLEEVQAQELLPGDLYGQVPTECAACV